MVNAIYNNKKFCLPESFNELSGKQLIGIAGLQYQEEQEDLAKLKALQIIMGYGPIRFLLLSADIKHRLLTFVDFVFDKNKLTEQVIPVYKGFHGPRREFDNLTLAEFHETEINYQVFVNGESEEEKDGALNNLVAVLYRKPKAGYNRRLDSDGDIRMPFNSNELAYYSRKIKKWPLSVRLAILMYYDGCRQEISDLYDKIFCGGTGGDNKAGMYSIIRGLAGTKYGDFDKVENLNIHTALSDLEEQMEEAEEIERQSRAA